MQTVKRQPTEHSRHVYRTHLAAAALLAAVSALPAQATQSQLRHGLLLSQAPAGMQIGRVKGTRSQKVARATVACPGPLDLVHATPVCEDALEFHAGVDTLPHIRGGGVRLPAPQGEQDSALETGGQDGTQLPGLRYTWHAVSASYTFGLLDTTTFIDTTDVSADSDTPFFAPALARNPTIQFPDDSLGGGMHWHGNENRPDLYLAVTSSHGLGDNPKASYGELIDIADAGKGVFVGAELEWEGRTSYRLGAWTNTAANPRLSGNGRTANYGLYGAAYGDADKTRWSLRAGVANGQVSAAAWFLSAAIDRDLGLVTAGLGTAVTGASGDLGAGTADSWTSELYLIHDFNDSVFISPHLQYQRNPGFDASGANGGRGQWVASLQSNVVF